MSKIDEFKNFVKDNPYLITHIKDNKMTWQKFYEIYDLYGQDEQVWKEYLSQKEEPVSEVKKNSSWNNIMEMAKNIDVDKVQNGITSLQKTIGLFGDLFTKKSSDPTTTNNSYKPRPLYRTFED